MSFRDVHVFRSPFVWIVKRNKDAIAKIYAISKLRETMKSRENVLLGKCYFYFYFLVQKMD